MQNGYQKKTNNYFLLMHGRVIYASTLQKYIFKFVLAFSASSISAPLTSMASSKSLTSISPLWFTSVAARIMRNCCYFGGSQRESRVAGPGHVVVHIVCIGQSGPKTRNSVAEKEFQKKGQKESANRAMNNVAILWQAVRHSSGRR